MYKKIVATVILLAIFMNHVIGSTYIYNPKDKLIEDNSSISTLAKENTPSFEFQSQAQYLIEPTTNEVLYANNENEKLLPASVTKVMASQKILLSLVEIKGK